MIYLGNKLNCVKDNSIISCNLLTSTADYTGKKLSIAADNGIVYAPLTQANKTGIKIRNDLTYSVENVVPNIVITGSHNITGVSGTYTHTFTFTKATLTVSLHSGITILVSSDRSTWITAGSISAGSYTSTLNASVSVVNKSATATVYYRIISNVVKTERLLKSSWLALNEGVAFEVHFGTGSYKAAELHATNGSLVNLYSGTISVKVTCYSPLLIPVNNSKTFLTRNQAQIDTERILVPIPSVLYATIEYFYNSGIEESVKIYTVNIYTSSLPVSANNITINFNEITGGGGVILDVSYSNSIIGGFENASEIPEKYW